LCRMDIGMSKYLIENLFGIEGLNIAWYGVIITFSIVLGVMLAIYRVRKQGISEDLIFDFILLVLPIAIVCARAYYVIFERDSFSGDILSVFKIWNGGLAIYGGVLGGLATSVLFCRYHKIPLFRFLDLVVPSLVLGQAMGRWGNFVNQEAFGNLVKDSSLKFFPYAVYIDALGEWHQATFFYESIWNVCLLIAMLIVSRKNPKTGTLTCMYFVIYGLGRFWIEGFRTDSLYIIPGIRVSQVLSLFLICGGILLYTFFVRRNKTKNMYSGKYLC